MAKSTIGDLRKFLEDYKGEDTDAVYGILTGLPGQKDDELAQFIATDLQPHMGKMRMGLFACAELPTTFEGAQDVVKNAFFMTTP